MVMGIEKENWKGVNRSQIKLGDDGRTLMLYTIKFSN